MSITVEDILALKSTQNFTLVAGKNGLKRPVKMVDMLDFGWDREKEYSSAYAGNNSLFDEGSFVISSLMFAHENPNKLYETIRRLIWCGVSGLAFKTAFYRTLPKEVCQLADKNNFAIFRIDDNVTYREIICDISDTIKLNQDIMISSECLSRMLYEQLSMEELSSLVSRISNSFRGYARVTLIMPETENEFSTDRIIRNFQLYTELKGKATLCGFVEGAFSGLALIVTMDIDDISKFDVITNHALAICNLNLDVMRIAYSNIHPTFTALNQCVLEAHQALLASRILGKNYMHYCDIGTLSFLIPAVDNSYIRTYMQTFLAPILVSEESLSTIVAFVRAGGNFSVAADELHIHKNTVRYRINKIHNDLSPNSSYEDFYELLATAVKIYLICELRA